MIDLGIVGTSFGRIVLGVAVMEDIALYAVLAIAVGLVSTSQVGLVRALGIDPTSVAGAAYYAAATTLVLVFAVTVGRHLLTALARTRSLALARVSPAAWLLIAIFAVTIACIELSVTSVFGGLAVGMMAGDLENDQFAAAARTISRFAFAFFVPLYFALGRSATRLDPPVQPNLLPRIPVVRVLGEGRQRLYRSAARRRKHQGIR